MEIEKRIVKTKKTKMVNVSDSAVEMFPLNYDCAYELFKRVGFGECMNLAEAYGDLQPIAEWMYKRKFNKLMFDFKQPIHRSLRAAGPTAKSLILTLDAAKYTTRDLIQIRRTCKQLRCLTLNGFDRENFRCNPFLNFGNGQLEVLTLNDCSLDNDVHFFDNYKSLKSFNMFKCYEIHAAAIDRCFRNNPGICSFTCNDKFFKFPQMLLLLENLERLSLYYDSFYMALHMLAELPSLRHLTLICNGDFANDVLTNLGRSNRLEELVLVDVDINEQTFPLIKSLQNLELLSIMPSNTSFFTASKDLPKSLKKLKLEGFRIANGNIASILEQLPQLEDMLLKNCELLHDDCWVSDFDWMADLVIGDVTGKHTQRRLNVTIKADSDQSSKVSIFR